MADSANLIHPTYRHLAREIHLAGLPLTQWLYLIAAAFAAFILSRLLPFGDTYNISVAVTVAGVPAAATIAGGMGETHALAYLRDLVRWRADTALYDPLTPSQDAPVGYVITGAPSAAGALREFHPAWLWAPPKSCAPAMRPCAAPGSR